MSSMSKNRIPREEVIIILIFAGICYFLGGVSGWGARCMTARDKWLISQVSRAQKEQDYYQAQLNQLVSGEKQRRLSNGR